MRSELRKTFALGFDPGDRYASVMGALFTIAAELYERGSCPEEWHFRPGAMSGDCRESDDFLYAECVDASTDALIDLGNLLNRAADAIRDAGESY